MTEEARLRRALERIIEVEPFSGTARLDVADWARALDKAQRIARGALEAPTDRGPCLCDDDAETPRDLPPANPACPYHGAAS